MGNHENISAEKYPVQSKHLLERVEVSFNYNTKDTLYGTIIRDDREDPFETIILLDDQKVVKGTECQYRPTNWFVASISEIDFDENKEFMK